MTAGKVCSPQPPKTYCIVCSASAGSFWYTFSSEISNGGIDATAKSGIKRGRRTERHYPWSPPEVLVAPRRTGDVAGPEQDCVDVGTRRRWLHRHGHRVRPRRSRLAGTDTHLRRHRRLRCIRHQATAKYFSFIESPRIANRSKQIDLKLSSGGWALRSAAAPRLNRGCISGASRRRRGSS